MVRGVHTRRTAIRYTVVLEQESDGGYVASVPALAGCVSQGDSRAEALANIREAIELYVEDCRDAATNLMPGLSYPTTSRSERAPSAASSPTPA